MNIPVPFNSKLRFIGILLLLIALFGGKFTFDRLFAHTARTQLFELRYWCIAVSAIIGFFYVRRERFSISQYSRKAIGILIALFLVAIYLSINSIILGSETNLWSYLLDNLMLIAGAILIIFYFRTETDLVVFAKFAEVIGFLLFILSILGFGNPELNGLGWSPVGGPITFYRMEFLSFCSALYLYARSEPSYHKFIHIIIAGIGLYSSLASLSKAALIGAAIVIVYFLFWQLADGNKKQAAVVFLLSILVFIGFYGLNGSIMRTRIVTSGVKEQKQAGVNYRNLLLQIYSPTVTFQELNKAQQEIITTVANTYKVYGPPDHNKNLPAFIRYAGQIISFRDHSERFLLSLHAWKLFKENVWFGAGIGNYHYSVINSCTTLMENYRYPHNIILELLATAGLAGLLIFGGTLFSVAVLLQQLLNKNKNSLFFIGYCFFIFVTALYAGDYYDFRLFWFVALIVLSSLHIAGCKHEQKAVKT